MRRAGSRLDERGLAAPAVVTLAFVLVAVTVAGSVGGRLLVEHRRVVAAADLSALAAATALQRDEPACRAARRFAGLNGAGLERCTVRGDVVEVVLTRTVDVPVAGSATLSGTARAGPADVDGLVDGLVDGAVDDSG